MLLLVFPNRNLKYCQSWNYCYQYWNWIYDSLYTETNTTNSFNLFLQSYFRYIFVNSQSAFSLAPDQMIINDDVRVLLVPDIHTISVADDYTVPRISLLHLFLIQTIFNSKHFHAYSLYFRHLISCPISIFFFKVFSCQHIIFLTLWHLVFILWFY